VLCPGISFDWLGKAVAKRGRERPVKTVAKSKLLHALSVLALALLVIMAGFALWSDLREAPGLRETWQELCGDSGLMVGGLVALAIAAAGGLALHQIAGRSDNAPEAHSPSPHYSRRFGKWDCGGGEWWLDGALRAPRWSWW